MMTEPPLSSYCEPWSLTEDKQFEACLAQGYLDIEDESTRWLQIAHILGGKRTPAEIENHYNELVYDVKLIESGRVPLPNYPDSYNLEDDDSEDDDSKPDDHEIKCQDGSCKSSTRPRKKGFQWSKDEHRLFLAGVKIFKKGDWRSISRNLVTTRSPTQVASHAQKFYSRNEPANIKKRKRSSIHDITVNDDAALRKLHQKGLLPTCIFDKLRSMSHVQQPPTEIEIKEERSNEQVSNNNNNNSISPNYQLQTPQVVHCEQVSNNNNSISPNYQFQTPQVVQYEQVSYISQSQFQPQSPLPHQCCCLHSRPHHGC